MAAGQAALRARRPRAAQLLAGLGRRLLATTDGGGGGSGAAKDHSATGLPLEQRCKNLLVGNWRGQLTTIDSSRPPADGAQPAVLSALVTYASPKGLLPPAILLAEPGDAATIRNLRENSLASLTIGRTDPPALVSTLRSVGMLLPCLSLLGDATEMKPAELGFVLRRAQRVYSRIAGFPSDWEGRAQEPGCTGFALHIQSARYVDMTGQQHSVTRDEIDRAFADPLAPGQARLLASLNSEPEQLHSLRMFCAAYMGCPVRQALLTQADRRGFTLMAEPIERADGAWREFRIAFNREIPSVAAFVSTLAAMREEAEGMLVPAQPT